MRVWAELYAQHQTVRPGAKELPAAIRRRLVELAARKHCSPTIQGRFTRRDRGPVGEWLIDQSDPGSSGELLEGLPWLRNARLTVLALVSRRTEHVHKFTAMIEGIARTERPWTAAVHLDDDLEPEKQDRKGSGACGHAAFHCHVGPTLDDEPKVRVPFPAVTPADALDWLLSTVVPDWEPFPWNALKDRMPGDATRTR